MTTPRTGEGDGTLDPAQAEAEPDLAPSLPGSSGPIDNARLLRDEAARAGFHRFGLCPVAPWERHEVYRRWLALGHAGEMGYLAEQADDRSDPRRVLPTARSIVSVGLSYAAPEPPEPGRSDGRAHAFIARYARGEDYHTVLKRRLQKMAASVAARLGRPIAWTACVDTAPVLEREAAHRGGVGFLAKNTMIIAPGLGSYLLLGELLTDLEVVPNEAAEARCGRCRACLDACPTGAITEAYTVDARRCISYLTIESRGPIPRALRPALENMIFGCDRCQEVCPFNAPVAAGHIAVPADPALLPLPKRDRPALVDLMRIGAAQFRKLQRRSAMRRVHRSQLLRNVAVALGNIGGPNEVGVLVEAFAEPAALVREHVAWALGAIARRHPSSSARTALHARLAVETDDAVRAEVALSLAEIDAGMAPH